MIRATFSNISRMLDSISIWLLLFLTFMVWIILTSLILPIMLSSVDGFCRYAKNCLKVMYSLFFCYFSVPICSSSSILSKILYSSIVLFTTGSKSAGLNSIFFTSMLSLKYLMYVFLVISKSSYVSSCLNRV